jgi:ribosome biogenesis GTPase
MQELEIAEYADWVRDKLDASMVATHELSRVISVARDRYVLVKGRQAALAELSGNFLYSVDSAIDLPTTGDWVYADFYDDATQAIIFGLAPRRTLIKRKTPGKRVEFQLIAANIDIAFIVQSADKNFNLRRLERYLVMVNENGIAPVILLSKSDLASCNEIDDLRESIASIAPGIAVITISSLRMDGIEAISDYLQRGVTACLLGSSGVGKTTLLNCLLGEQKFATRSVSDRHGKGRHTTTSRELIELRNGAMIVDTPGMRELGNISVDTGIDSTFAEIAELARDCRFADCSHTNEKGCAILAALAAGSLPSARLQNYMKMRKESVFNEMSYADKRKKDKDFGKMVNAAVRSKRR